MGRKQQNEDGMSPRTKAEKTLIATIGQVMVNSLNEAGPDDLKARLVALAGEERDIEAAMKENEELANTKERAKDLEAPYKDSLKGVTLQRKYIASLLEEKGKL